MLSDTYMKLKYRFLKSLLVIFSDSVPLSEKWAIAKALHHHPQQSNEIDAQQMLLLTEYSLVDLAGKYSWTLLQLLNVDDGFLKADPKSWQQNSGCITAHIFLKNLNAANDASEHTLKKVARIFKEQCQCAMAKTIWNCDILLKSDKAKSSKG